MGISAHIARLRAAVGHDLLLLPSVSVLPVDAAGRLLLVRHAGHHDGWAVLGGAVELGESSTVPQPSAMTSSATWPGSPPGNSPICS